MLFGIMNVHLKLEELVENYGSKKAIQHQLNLQKQYPLKVLIWGTIGRNQKSDLYFIEPGKRLNSQYYQQIVEGSLVKSAIFIIKTCYFHAKRSSLSFISVNN